MSPSRAITSLCGVFALMVGPLFGQAVSPAKSPVAVRDVKFMQVRIGGQEHPWNRMQVEIQANATVDPKAV